MKKRRPEKIGEQIGWSIIEMVHLMYQNRTALFFLKGLIYTLLAEYIKRRKSYKYAKEFYDLESFFREL